MPTPPATPIHRQISSFRRWLQFENKSANTMEIYTHAARKMAAWLVAEHDVTDWGAVRPSHVRDFIITILEQHSAGRPEIPEVLEDRGEVDLGSDGSDRTGGDAYSRRDRNSASESWVPTICVTAHRKTATNQSRVYGGTVPTGRFTAFPP